jgi:hypothetical protein
MVSNQSYLPLLSRKDFLINLKQITTAIVAKGRYPPRDGRTQPFNLTAQARSHIAPLSHPTPFSCPFLQRIFSQNPALFPVFSSKVHIL